MLRHHRVTAAVAASLALLSIAAVRTVDRHAGKAASRTAGTYGMRLAPIHFQSVGVMSFGSDGTLYVADSRAGAVYAIDVGGAERDTSTNGLAIKAIDEKIAASLGVSKDAILIHDMVAHPLTQAVYFSVTKGHGDAATPLIVRVAKRDQRITVVPTGMIRHARAELPHASSRDTTTPWEGVPRSFTMTHLAVGDGELYVAGLSNQEFKSTLRRVPLPFGAAAVTTDVEVFHTSHDRFETASPIESLLPVTVNGRHIVLASYTCSPLAIFDRDALRGAGVVRGKTVAELGGGNRPFDMVTYTSPKTGRRYVMVANSERTLMRFDLDSLASATPMTAAVTHAYQPGGVPYLPVASFGVLQLDNYNAKNLIVLERSQADGTLDLAPVAIDWF